jgi:2-polyprenyl-6-methoxyphenol hydroxylase-like FAD-dependent oxidoreductase
MNAQVRPHRGHALVIGGSIAGLCAARVLSAHFGHVTVIERDDLSKEGEYRPGVPQSRHLHLLLLRGRQILDRLFPELEAEFLSADVPRLNFGSDAEVVSWAGKHPRYPSAFEVRSSSRAWLESVLHRHVAALPRVEFRTQHEVVGLRTNGEQVVTGVEVRHADRREIVDADLVVDASGRNSKAIEWLGTLGFASPAITTINGFLGYATRWYEGPRDFAPGRYALITGSVPTTNPRAGVLFPIEGGRWVVTLAGLARMYPPTDEAGFLEFARQLVSPTIYEALQTLRPISPIYGYRHTENRWVHFERARRWPDRFVVLGDAACCFNPIYAQGMAVSAIEAALMDRELRVHGADLAGFAHRFQRHLPNAFRAAWLLATGEDFRWPTTEGGTPDLTTRVAHWYVDRLFELMPHSPETIETFMSVQHLLAPPLALFRPSLVARVLGQKMRRLLASSPFAPVSEPPAPVATPRATSEESHSRDSAA